MRVLHVLDHSLPHHSGYAIRSHNILRFQRQENIEPIALTSPKHISGFDWSSERYDEIEYQRVRNRINPFVEEILLMRSLAREIQRRVVENHPDIIHAHSPLLNGWPAHFIAKRAHIPLVYEVRAFWEDAAVDHGTAQPNSFKYRASKKLDTMLMRRADKIVTLSRTMREEILARGIEENKVYVVPNAVDASRFRPTKKKRSLVEQLGLNNSRIVGFIGSFYHYEGLDLLIRAFEKAWTPNHSLKLLLVGDGFEYERIKQLSAASPVGEHLTLTGRIDYSKICDYYSLLDIAVFPRYKMRLTDLVCPLKPLEAMAMEIAVVGSDVGGIREFIQHEETGLLFKPGDADALASAITRLCESSDLCKKIGSRGRKAVWQNWHWPVVIKRYVEIYRAAEIAMRANKGRLSLTPTESQMG